MRFRFAVLSLVVGLPVLACTGGDDDRIELPSTTTVLVDPVEEAKARLCEAFTSFVVAENRRAEAAGNTDDLAVRLEGRRTEALDTLVASLPEGTPAAVPSALTELRGIAIKPVPIPLPGETTTTDAAVAAAGKAEAVKVAGLAKVVTDHFDPTCDTIGGVPRAEVTTTTRPPAPAETTSTTA